MWRQIDHKFDILNGIAFFIILESLASKRLNKSVMLGRLDVPVNHNLIWTLDHKVVQIGRENLAVLGKPFEVALESFKQFGLDFTHYNFLLYLNEIQWS